MRSFMEAYGAVHSKEVKENLDNSRDSISEMNLSKMTESDLCEAVEEVLEVWFAEGHTVAECEAIVESILVPSQIPGRQGKIERLLEAFGAVIGRVKEKSARTAVESFALYRKGKQVKESWSNKFSHENGNERLHERLVAADFAKVKNGLLELYKGKHGQSEKEYADSRSPGGKMVSGDSKRSGAEYTHGRRAKVENPGMQPDVGGRTKPKSQGRMDAGSREDLKYRKANLERKHRIAKIAKEDFAGNYEGPLYAPHPDIEEGYKEIDKKKENAMYRRAGNLARKGIADNDSKAKEKSAKIVSAISFQKERERFSKMADEKARDNYREELEVSQIRKDWAAAYKSIYEVKDDKREEDLRQFSHKVSRGQKKLKAKSDETLEGPNRDVNKQPGKYAGMQRRKSQGLSYKEEVEVVDEAKADAGLTPLQKIRKRNKAYAMPGEKAGEQTSNRRAERASARGEKKERGAKSAFGTMRHVGGPYKEQVEVVDEAKKGDGNLANNYPPYDKVTRGDIIAGAKGEDQMGGKKCKKCGKSPCECPKEDVKEAKEKWIGSAIKKPGALHKQLGVPEGEPIPEAKLRAAAKQGGKLGQRARLALTLKGLNKEETDWEFLDNLIESEKFTEQQIQKIAEDL